MRTVTDHDHDHDNDQAVDEPSALLRVAAVHNDGQADVDGRLADGQLDDSNLTLRDIGRIREAFVEQLLGMYHQRITYPENVLPIERDTRSA